MLNETVEKINAERIAVREKKQKRVSIRRMWSLDNLPLARALFKGPKWKKYFEVREVPISEIDPANAHLHRPGRKLLIFTFEEDVRELICEPLGEGRYAQWSDPLERWASPENEKRALEIEFGEIAQQMRALGRKAR